MGYGFQGYGYGLARDTPGLPVVFPSPKNVFRIDDLPKSVDCSDPEEFAWQVVVNICVPFKKQERDKKTR